MVTHPASGFLVFSSSSPTEDCLEGRAPKGSEVKQYWVSEKPPEVCARRRADKLQGGVPGRTRRPGFSFHPLPTLSAWRPPKLTQPWLCNPPNIMTDVFLRSVETPVTGLTLFSTARPVFVFLKAHCCFLEKAAFLKTSCGLNKEGTNF